MERLRGESAEFVADVFGSLPRRDQRRWGECYLRGLMPDGRRKSIQPMAERLPDGNMQALQQFVKRNKPYPSPLIHTAPLCQRRPLPSQIGRCCDMLGCFFVVQSHGEVGTVSYSEFAVNALQMVVHRTDRQRQML